MPKRKFKYIYGPVYSWRLGRSLGVDLLSRQQKHCSFGCIYCQLGRTKSYATKRRLYVPTESIAAEIKALPKVKVDYITFSGRGEPTLAANLGKTIKAIRRIRREPIAVLTNSSLLHRKDVRAELALADVIFAKLDADSEECFQRINKPARQIKFSQLLRGIKQFREAYQGKLALQIMFTEENRTAAKDIAKLANTIQPDEVQINTPLRPSAAAPVCRRALLALKKHFQFYGMNVISVYDRVRKRNKVKAEPIDATATVRRR